MARSQARILTSIWHDRDFLARTAVAQRLYLLALSQDTVSFCGVISYTAGRWGSLAADTTVAAIRKGVAELVAHHFVVVDARTEELWIRSFLKYDGVLASPNLIRPMIRDFDAVHSQPIRDGIHQYIRDQLPDGLPEGFPKPIREQYQERFGEPIGDGPRAHGAGPLASCLLPLASKDTSPVGTGTHDPDPLPVENRDLELEQPPPKPGDLTAALAAIGNRGWDSDPPTGPAWVDPLANRLVAVCAGQRPETIRREADAVTAWARRHVDDQVIDEAVGYLEQADQKPNLPRAAAKLIRSKAADHGIQIPEFKPPSRVAS